MRQRCEQERRPSPLTTALGTHCSSVSSRACSLVGTFALKIAFNAPGDQAVASVSAGDRDDERFRVCCVVGSAAEDHLRMVAELAAAAPFGVALDL
jgi:uncharacterized membrane protein